MLRKMLAVGSWQLAVGSWQLAVGSSNETIKKQKYIEIYRNT